MAPSLASQLLVKQVGQDEYLSEHLPVRMGNARPIAYGGSTLGMATNAATATVPDTHKLYSRVAKVAVDRVRVTLHRTGWSTAVGPR